MKDELIIKKIISKSKTLYEKRGESIHIYCGNDITSLSSTITDVVSTGLPSLDIACAKSINNLYGLPFGRQVEIYGGEGTGKTTLLLQIARNVQQMGGIVYWIETESSLDINYAERLGVDINKIIISQPDYAEQIFEEIDLIIKTVQECEEKKPIAILWDSVAATQTQQELLGDFGDSHIASFARFISQAERKINTALAKNKILFCYTNQPRLKLSFGFRAPTIATYGEGTLKFYASIRLELKIKSLIRDDSGDKVIGSCITAKIAKNRCLPTTFVEIDNLQLIKGWGFDYYSSLVDAMLVLGIITTPSKGWYMLDGVKYRLNDLKNKLRKNEELHAKSLELIKQRVSYNEENKKEVDVQ